MSVSVLNYCFETLFQVASGKGRARCRASQDVLKEMNPLVLDGVELASNRRLATEYFAVLTRRLVP